MTSHWVKIWVEKSGFSSRSFQNSTRSSWKHSNLAFEFGRYVFWLS